MADTKIIVGSDTRFAAIAQAAKQVCLDIRDEVVTLRGELDPILNDLQALLDIAADLQNINDVQAKLAEIDAVAGKLAEIEALSDRTTEIDALFANLAQLVALAGALSELVALHANLQALLDVESNLTEINAVEAKLTEIQAVFDSLQEIDDVAGALVNIGLVAGSIGNVDAVGSNIAAVLGVQDNEANINTVAGDIANVNINADNIAAIITNADNIQAIIDAQIEVAAAVAARDKAEQWADNPEDVPVETDPDRFSAFHWAQKSAAEADINVRPSQPPEDSDNFGYQNVEGTLKRVPYGELLADISIRFEADKVFGRFGMLVKSDNAGTSTDTQFTFTGAQVETGSTFPVAWREKDTDGWNTETLDVSDPTITFPAEGEYLVYAGQPFNRIRFNDGGDKLKVLEITQWGDIRWSSMEAALYGCSNMQGNFTDAPDLSMINTMSRMFQNCSLFNAPIGSWDVSSVENMSILFFGASAFNQDISGWDVSSVESMGNMLRGSAFNQDIGGWDVSNVTIMGDMFRDSSFNQDIGGWDVGNVSTMRDMFRDNSAFNQDISGWDVSSVSNFIGVFRSASAFNQDLSSWDIESANDMSTIFAGSGMSCENYTDTLVGWANFVESTGGPLNISATGQTGMTFATSRDGGAAFDDAGLARIFLTTSPTFGAGWSISGDTVQTNC